MVEASVFKVMRENPANQTAVKLFVIDQAERADVVIPNQPTILVNPSVHPRFSPDGEFARQAELLAYLFAKPLGFKSRWEYMDRLPNFPAQPTEDLDIPVIVQAAVLAKGLTRAKILNILDVNYDNAVIKAFKDWERDPIGFKTPEVYATYMDDGSNHLNKRPVDVRAALTPEKRMGTDWDGLYLIRVYPAVLDHHYLDLSGTQVGSADGADLYRFEGLPWLYYDWVDSAHPHWGSVLAGRNINIGNLFP